MKVLHVISVLNRGGIECWLMNLLRLRAPEIDFHFLVFHEGTFDAEARGLGATIHRLPFRRPCCVARGRRDIYSVMKNGHYDAVHYHLFPFAGLILKDAHSLGIPVRVAHAHNTGVRPTLSGFVRRCYAKTFDFPRLARHATHLLACSEEAGASFLGRNLWRERHPKKMVYCGIPLDHFDMQRTNEKRQDLCRKFNMSDDAIVIGHVGRLTYQKNQEFMLELFQKLAQRNPRYYLFIAGEGELREPLEKQVVRLGLQDRVRMPGALPNMPELTTQLFDTFLLPSHFEGFGIVVIEAIAAGLHCVCSDVMTTDLTVPLSDRISTLSLKAPLSDWCDAIEESLSRRESPQEGVTRMKQTPFSIEQSMETLLEIYADRERLRKRGGFYC